MLLRILLCLLLYGSSASAQTFRLYLAGDVTDREFGVATISDLEAVSDMAKMVSNILEYKLEIKHLTQRDFNAGNARNVLNGIRSKRKDILFFYYSGKGLYPESSTSRFPVFDMPSRLSKPLSLDEVAAIFDSKKESLGIVMADCRDTFPTGFSIDGDLTISEDFVEKLIIQKVFLGSCGIVKVASSSEGQPVYTTKGGSSSAFTHGFTRNLNLMLSWAGIRDIDRISLDFLINMSSGQWQNEGGTEPQTSVTERLPCPETRRPLAVKFPSFKNAISYEELAKSNNTTVRNNRQGNSITVANDIKQGFHKKARVTIKKLKEPNFTPIETVTLPIEDYWKHVSKVDATLMDRRINSNSVRRTSDFTKILSMEVEEVYK